MGLKEKIEHLSNLIKMERKGGLDEHIKIGGLLFRLSRDFLLETNENIQSYAMCYVINAYQEMQEKIVFYDDEHHDLYEYLKGIARESFLKTKEHFKEM